MGGQTVEGLEGAMTKSAQWVGMLFLVAMSYLNRE